MEIITIHSVKPHGHTPQFYKNKGMKTLAEVVVNYYDLTINCNLMTGLNDKGDHFYFLSMPAKFYKNHKGIDKKFSMCQWPEKEMSDKFQQAVMTILLAEHQEYFKASIGE